MFVKKIFLIVAIAGIFLIYSAGIRHKAPVIKKPPSIATSSTSGSVGGSATGTSAASSTSTSSTQYKDGTFTGSVEDAYYGNVQVAVTISGGKISKVKFLQYPNTHSTSVIINSQAMPYLQQEAIHAQNSKVNLISGATFTSQAFVQSLQNALSQA